MQGLAVMDALMLPERDTEWMDRAACRGATGVTFFPDMPRDPSKAERARYDKEADEAKQICTSCPVRDECLEDAISRDEHWGIWGGEDFYVPWRKLRHGRKA